MDPPYPPDLDSAGIELPPRAFALLQVAADRHRATDSLRGWNAEPFRRQMRATADVVRMAVEGVLVRGSPAAADAEHLSALWGWKAGDGHATSAQTRRHLKALRLPHVQERRALKVMDDLKRGLEDDDLRADIGFLEWTPAGIGRLLQRSGAVAWYFGLLAEVGRAESRAHAYASARAFLPSAPRGLRKGMITPTLYCLRPTDFPILGSTALDTMRDVGVECRPAVDDYADWSACIVDANARLGLDADLWELDRLLHAWAFDFDVDYEILVELDRRFVGLARSSPDLVRRDINGFVVASRRLSRWLGQEEEIRDPESGLLSLAVALSFMYGRPYDRITEIIDRLRACGSSVALFRTLEDAIDIDGHAMTHEEPEDEWNDRPRDPWPIAVERLLDWYGEEFASDVLHAFDPEGHFGLFREDWWAALTRLGTPVSVEEEMDHCRTALAGARLGAAARRRVLERVGTFAGKSEGLGDVMDRYEARGPRAFAVLPALLGPGEGIVAGRRE